MANIVYTGLAVKEMAKSFKKLRFLVSLITTAN